LLKRQPASGDVIRRSGGPALNNQLQSTTAELDSREMGLMGRLLVSSLA